MLLDSPVAMEIHLPTILTGAGRSVVVPSPISPYRFFPQTHNVPSDLISAVCLYPGASIGDPAYAGAGGNSSAATLAENPTSTRLRTRKPRPPVAKNRTALP
jgi:hypothetical protein